jgi:hypothetical protein
VTITLTDAERDSMIWALMVVLATKFPNGDRSCTKAQLENIWDKLGAAVSDLPVTI